MKLSSISVMIVGFLFVFGLFAPFSATAAPNSTEADLADLTFAAWVPYWKGAAALTETQANLNKLAVINPFSYEVRADGAIWDPMRIGKGAWPDLLSAARAQKVKIIPSILWNDSQAIQRNLFNVKKRRAHEDQIVALVKANNFDGIDIDYENKLAAVKPYFSKFIIELSAKTRAAGKTLICTIEPRTPDSSRFNVIPPDIKFANDYQVLGKYCDEVRLMAYDQMTIDLRLNESKGLGDYYAPVADADWVVKIINVARQEIPADKIVLGAVNYGYEYEVTGASPYYRYKKIRALTYKTMVDLAQSLGLTPARNAAGELGFSYQKDGRTRVISLSDSVAIADKIALARKYGLKGVVLFKVDGESDPELWTILK